MMVGYGGSIKEKKLAEITESEIKKNQEFECHGEFQIGAVIGSHTGPVVGVVVLPKIDI